MTFETTSVFAQTWGLVFLVVMFVIAMAYALRPSARKKFEAAAQIPLKED